MPSAGRACGQGGRGESKGDGHDVGEHVPRVGEQGDASGDQPAGHLDDEEHHEDDQHERERPLAPAPLGRVAPRGLEARVGMIVAPAHGLTTVSGWPVASVPRLERFRAHRLDSEPEAEADGEGAREGDEEEYGDDRVAEREHICTLLRFAIRST